MQIMLKFNQGVHATLLTEGIPGETYFREGEILEGTIIRPADPDKAHVDLQLDDGSVAVGVPKENVEEISLDYASVGRWEFGG